MTEGLIPVLDFLRFIQLETGKLVLHPSENFDSAFSTKLQIHVLGDVSPMTYPIAKSLLEMNGYELSESTLVDGTEVIRVSHTGSRTHRIPDPVGVYIQGELPTDLSPQTRATVVIPIRHIESTTAVGALRDLFSRGKRGTDQVAVVHVQASNTIVVTSKLDTLRHVEKLVEHLDREAEEQQPKMMIVRLRHAPADEIANVLRAFVSSKSMQAGMRANPEEKVVATTIVSDARTQSLLVETDDVGLKRKIEEIIRSLDVPVESAEVEVEEG